MTNLKRSFFWAALYLAVIFVLGQADYTGSPIIDFASYFYLAVMIAVPVTLFFPSVSKVSSLFPLLIWAGIYMVLLQTLDRSISAKVGEFSVIILEFTLLEVGVWFAFQLTRQISHAESVMDAIALTAFPNRTHDIVEEEQRIKVELTRSRRYHRPLCAVMIATEGDDQKMTREMLKSIQHDLTHRFNFARIGQIIDDRVRQVDLVLRDHKDRYIVLCPETELDNAMLLAGRIEKAIKERTSLDVRWGVAAFPDEALTFDDLLLKARERLNVSVQLTDGQITVLDAK